MRPPAYPEVLSNPTTKEPYETNSSQAIGSDEGTERLNLMKQNNKNASKPPRNKSNGFDREGSFKNAGRYISGQQLYQNDDGYSKFLRPVSKGSIESFN